MRNVAYRDNSNHINVLLADDHHVVRRGICSLLEKEPDIKVFAEAVNGQDVLKLVTNGKMPDVIITDINMPGLNGIQLIEQVKTIAPEIKIIVLSMLENESFVTKAFSAGASGYLLKSVSPDELLFALRHVYADQQYLSSELTTRLIKRLVNVPDIVQQNENTDLDFTEREIEIMQLIANGYTNEKIAEKLFMSKRTAEAHRKTLLDKTGTVNTAALVGFAIRNGLIN